MRTSEGLKGLLGRRFGLPMPSSARRSGSEM